MCRPMIWISVPGGPEVGSNPLDDRAVTLGDGGRGENDRGDEGRAERPCESRKGT